jgi:hypothetical protein
MKLVTKISQVGLLSCMFIFGAVTKVAWLYYVDQGVAIRVFEDEPLTEDAFNLLVEDVEFRFDDVHCIGYPSLGVVYIIDEKGKFGYLRRYVSKYVQLRIAECYRPN